MDYSLLEKYGGNISVLLIDDDEEIRLQLGSLLKDIFFKVDFSSNGKQGYEKYITYYGKNKIYYDIVILDINMPEMNGVELTKKIFDKNCEQKIIILSACSDSKYLLELINTDIYKYILKPFSKDEILSLFYKISKEIFEKKYDVNKNQKSSYIKLSEGLIWDRDLKQLFFNNENIKLTKKEFRFLDLLSTCSEKIYHNVEILEYVWQDEPQKNPDLTNLKNLISRLRKKVPSLNIDNCYGIGYKIIT